MATKQALGLAVSGTEVRLALLSSHNGKIHIEGLERARLRTTLENKPAVEEENNPAEGENNDAFGLKTAVREKENNAAAPTGGAQNDNGNLEILYRLLEKYTKRKTRIAFNVPLSMVKYQRPEAALATERPAEAGKDADSSFAEEVLTAHDGSRLIMSYEKQPPTMSLMRDVNEFLRGHLYLALMDSTEVALANLARRDDDAAAGKISAIVYIEDDFTRLIFMRGKDLIHVSSIIHENTASPDILEVIYRKLIYEQDEAQIPEIATILLAGKSSRIKAREFFAAYFQAARVDYLTSPEVTGLSSNDMQRGVFSEFAVPIALAWKTLEPKSPFFIPTNLLPQDLLDQQQILKLNYHGYILLALAGLVAFFMTWQIGRLHNNIRDLRKTNAELERKIASNQETVDRVLLLDNQCQRLKMNLAMADSLSLGHDEFLAFLKKLNNSVGRVGNIGVDEIITSNKGFSVRGTSLSREAIPLLAERLERASLSQVTRVESELAKRKYFSFNLERRSEPDTTRSGLSSIDAARYASNGKMIFSKEGVRLATPMSPEGMAGSAPATMQRNETPALSSAAPNANGTTGSDRNVAPRNEVAPPPIIRPAAAATDNVSPPNKNGQTVAAASAAEKPQPVLRESAAPPKPAERTPQFSNGAARAEADEIKKLGTAERAGAATTFKPAPNNFANGATNRPAEALVNSSTRTEKISIAENSGPAASRPAVSRPAEALPETARPEIFRGYTIEAATSYTAELAEQYAAAYRKQGHDAAVENYLDERTGAKKYRVLIGAFATRPAAEMRAAQIAGLLMKDYRVVGIR
jgi:hypothetical protein